MTFAAAQKMMKPAAALAAAGSLGLAGCATTNFSALAPDNTTIHPNGGLVQLCADLNGGVRIVYSAPAKGKHYLVQIFGDVNAFSMADRFATVITKMPGYLITLNFDQARGELIPHLTDKRPNAEWDGVSPVPSYPASVADAREAVQAAISDVGATPRRLKGGCDSGRLDQFTYK